MLEEGRKPNVVLSSARSSHDVSWFAELENVLGAKELELLERSAFVAENATLCTGASRLRGSVETLDLERMEAVMYTQDVRSLLLNFKKI